MPFYIRKSVSAGPFRFNFSTGGVGVSVGVKGLRIGTGPRGHYIHAGRGGLYYRATLGRAGQRPVAPQRQMRPPAVAYESTGVHMVEIESGSALEMRDEQFSDLLSEINAKQAQARMAPLLGWSCAIAGGLALFASAELAGGLLVAILPAYFIGRWIDSYRRRAVLYYDLDEEAAEAYRRLTEAFDGMAGCAGKWHIEAGGAVQDITTWKRNAGASHIVQKKPTALHYALPEVLVSNVTPPSAHVGRQVVYFLPDALFVIDGKTVGAVGYRDLQIRWQDSNFIEDGAVPRDAQVIAQTWKHPNKNGGPDRRFANNHQIPICRYEAMHMTSGNGLNELLEFSRTGVVAPFSTAIASMARAVSLRRSEAITAETAAQ